jgi:hypothetical protein
MRPTDNRGKSHLTNRITYIIGYCAGIRSACTYLNSRNLKELYDNIEFVKVNNIK